VIEDRANGARIGDEGNDAHRSAAVEALQMQNLIDARQEQRPQDER
jgi:hypothetical protein